MRVALPSGILFDNCFLLVQTSIWRKVPIKKRSNCSSCSVGHPHLNELDVFSNYDVPF